MTEPQEYHDDINWIGVPGKYTSVEVAYVGPFIWIRHPTDPNVVVKVLPQEWDDFLFAVESGVFDLPDLRTQK